MFGIFGDIEVSENNGVITISNWRGTRYFLKQLVSVRYSNRVANNLIKVKSSGFSIPSFYAVELVYIIDVFLSNKPSRKTGMMTNLRDLKEIKEKLLTNTWLIRTIDDNYKPYLSEKINKQRVDELNYKPDNVQANFIYNVYLQMKTKYNLNGYLLSFDMGLGKTFTSLATFHGMGIKKVIVICQQTALENTWVNEIGAVFPTEKKIWSTLHANEPLNDSYDFYLSTYQSINKLFEVIPSLKKHDVGVIVDESHFFKNEQANRTEELTYLVENLKTNNVLLMSGTPVKAMVKEMIPILNILDPLFTPTVKDTYIKTFGYNSPAGLDIVNHRLGIVMLRESNIHLNLPKVSEEVIKIKIKDGDQYTLDAIKVIVSDYVDKRTEYYSKHIKVYEDAYLMGLNAFKETLSSKKELELFDQYRKDVKLIIKYGVLDPTMKPIVMSVNKYEKEIVSVLRTLENGRDLAVGFKDAKTVIKYVNLKIMGEVIGNILPKMREEMTIKMVEQSNLIKHIQDADKKTICFTTFVQCANRAYEFIKSQNIDNMIPVLVTGENMKGSKERIDQFIDDPNYNPMIATIGTMGVSVTLTVANQIIFFNPPWRSTDKMQAIARANRRGQDTNVVVKTYELDTGNLANLSTRMNDILDWSKDMFGQIVDGEFEKDINTIKTSTFNAISQPKSLFNSIRQFRLGATENFVDISPIDNRPMFLNR